jgi:hypothetical protein
MDRGPYHEGESSGISLKQSTVTLALNNECAKRGEGFFSGGGVLRRFILVGGQIEHHLEMLRPTHGKAYVSTPAEP